MRYVVLDYRIDKEIVSYFENKNLEVIYTKKLDQVIDAINGHVDIQMFYDKRKLFVAKEVYEYYKEKLDEKYLKSKGIELIETKESLSKKYPGDVKLNLCYTGEYYIGNYNMLDEKIQKYLNEENKMEKFINVTQGYSNCSICIVSKNIIITSDKGIHKTINEYNKHIEGQKNITEKDKSIFLKSYLIKEGDIDLFELNYGFIGGCSGKDVEDDKIYFFGSLEEHSSKNEIIKIIKNSKSDIKELKKSKLIDYGGLYFI